MTRWVCAFVLVLAIGARVEGSMIFVPPGLSAGDTYHLVFVTLGLTTALSDDIAYYNDFANAQATRTGAFTEHFGLTWYAIGSTPDVDARDNALVSGAVFRLDGEKVADGYADIWDGTVDANINLTQFRTSTPLDRFDNPIVFTGTLPNGVGSDDNSELGGSQPSSIVGRTDFAPDPREADWIRTGATGQQFEYPIYALSELITMRAAVPEPASVEAWSLLGVVGFLTVKRRRRR